MLALIPCFLLVSFSAFGTEFFLLLLCLLDCFLVCHFIHHHLLWISRSYCFIHLFSYFIPLPLIMVSCVTVVVVVYILVNLLFSSSFYRVVVVGCCHGCCACELIMWPTKQKGKPTHSPPKHRTTNDWKKWSNETPSTHRVKHCFWDAT